MNLITKLTDIENKNNQKPVVTKGVGKGRNNLGVCD